MQPQNLAWSRADILQKKPAGLILLFGNLNYPYYHEVKVPTKIRPFLYNHLKVRPSSTVTSWSFRKNKAVLLRYFENLNCHYNHELKFAEQ